MLRHRGPERAEDGARQGFTLIELLVTVITLGIIIVPLGMAFTTGLKLTDEVSGRLLNAQSRQTLASLFTSDVQAVAATGDGDPALESTGELRHQPCPLDPAPADGTALFNLTPDVGAGSGQKVTYWATGQGRTATVVRAACNGTSASDETIVADRFGERGDLRTTLVTGIAGQQYCDARRCALTINGTYQYTLTVDRRVSGFSPSDARPGEPSPVVARPLDQAASLRWAPPVETTTQPEPTGYRITGFQVVDTNGNGNLEDDGFGTPLPALTVDIPATSLETIIGGLTNGLHYRFRVQALTATAEGGIGTSGAVTPGLSAPSAPTPIAVLVGDRAATVQWGSPQNDGGSAVTRYTVSDGTTSVTLGQGARPLATSHRFTGLTNGVTRTFTVTASNSVGSTSASATATPVGRPLAPQDVGTLGDPGYVSAVRFRGDDGTAFRGNALRVTVNGNYAASQLAGASRVSFWRISAYPWADLSRTPVVRTVNAAAVATQNDAVVITGDPTNPSDGVGDILNGTPYGVRVEACTQSSATACDTQSLWSVPSAMARRDHLVSSLGDDPRVTALNASVGATDQRRTAYPTLSVPSGKPNPVSGLDTLAATTEVTWTGVQPGALANNGADILDYRFEVTRDAQRQVPWASISFRQPSAVPDTGRVALPTLKAGTRPRVAAFAFNRGEWYVSTDASRISDLDGNASIEDFNADIGPTPQMPTYPIGGDLMSSRASRYAGQSIAFGETNKDAILIRGWPSNQPETDNTLKLYSKVADDMVAGDTGYWAGGTGNEPAYSGSSTSLARDLRFDGGFGYWRQAFGRDSLTYGGNYRLDIGFPAYASTASTYLDRDAEQFLITGMSMSFDVDFDATQTAFVAANGLDNSTNTGVAPNLPKRSIVQGALAGSANGRPNIIVGGGAYAQVNLTDVEVADVDLPATTITGGFNASTWRRSDPGTNVTAVTGSSHALLIDGQDVPTNGGIDGSDGPGVRSLQSLRQMTFTSTNPSTTSTDAVYGARVINAGKVAFTAVTITSAGANDGQVGGTPGIDAIGGAPLNGAAGGTAGSNTNLGDNSVSGGATGVGGTNSGGRGGRGGYSNQDGFTGGNGSAGGGGGGGGGWRGYSFPDCDNAAPGSPGSRGTGPSGAGTPGSGGSGGTSGGSAALGTGATYAPPTNASGADGTNAVAGQAGGGGGGGGGGSRETGVFGIVLCFADQGASGGGGGAGGGAGTRGTGGSHGGSSFGVYAFGTGSSVDFLELAVDGGTALRSTVTAGRAGNGRDGGRGGNGVNGGAGGRGGTCRSDQEAGGGAGGAGGNGGGGGGGGGGGAGGHSVAVFLTSNASIPAGHESRATLVAGSAGTGGTFGARGNAGNFGAGGAAGGSSGDPSDISGEDGCRTGGGGPDGVAGLNGTQGASGGAGTRFLVRRSDGTTVAPPP